jgi:hypothetical protein
MPKIASSGGTADPAANGLDIGPTAVHKNMATIFGTLSWLPVFFFVMFFVMTPSSQNCVCANGGGNTAAFTP